MERESDKHSPRIDDAMAHDLDSLLRGAPGESRAQESRLQEDPDVGPGRRFNLDDGRGLAISDDEADQRADLARHLAGATFPAGRDELVAAAQADYAPESMVEALRGLPEDGAFANVQGVWEAMGGDSEKPHTR